MRGIAIIGNREGMFPGHYSRRVRVYVIYGIVTRFFFFFFGAFCGVSCALDDATHCHEDNRTLFSSRVMISYIIYVFLIDICVVYACV